MSKSEFLGIATYFEAVFSSGLPSSAGMKLVDTQSLVLREKLTELFWAKIFPLIESVSSVSMEIFVIFSMSVGDEFFMWQKYKKRDNHKLSLLFNLK